MCDELELCELESFEYECGTPTFIEVNDPELSNDSQERAVCPRCEYIDTSF